jgi:biotin carboxylase
MRISGERARPRLHVLGGGQWQVPTIKLAGRIGASVLVTDCHAERPGYRYADQHETVDITDLDQTLAVARDREIDGIVCDTTDAGVPTMAYVAERLGLPGIPYEVALNFTRKDRMRELTNAVVPRPVRYRTVRDWREAAEAAAEIGYPFIVKPADSQSSRGVRRVSQPAELAVAVDLARQCSRAGVVLLEEMLTGMEVTVEGFMYECSYVTAGISDKVHFEHRPEVAQRITYPAELSRRQLNELIAINKRVVHRLGMDTCGVTHAEYFVDGSDIGLVEIAARGGGSRLYSDIAPRLAGVDIPRAYLEWLLGRTVSPIPCEKYGAAVLEFFEFSPGIVRRIDGLETARQIPGVQEIMLEFSLGDELKRAVDDRSRPGFMIVFGPSRNVVLERARLVKEHLVVTTDPVSHHEKLRVVECR